MKHRKSDILWKVVLQEVFAGLLRFVFPDADEVYDMERGFLFLDKELAELNPQPNEGKDSKFADKLVKVYHRDGVEEWILLHVEVQGDTHDGPAFARRMFTYFYRILDLHRGRPVAAVAIFTGQDCLDLPNRYVYAYRGTRLVYEYATVPILKFSDEELEKSNNPFAQVIIAARMRLKEGKLSEDTLLEIKILAAQRLLEKGFDKAMADTIYNFLRNYVLFEMPETNCKFDEVFRNSDKISVMSTEEYLKMKVREEVWEEQAKLFVEYLLKESNHSVEKIASLAKVDVDFVIMVQEDLKATC